MPHTVQFHQGPHYLLGQRKHFFFLKNITCGYIQWLIYAMGHHFYQSPLILTELFQHNLINVSYLTACYLYQVMITLHFLNDVAYDAELTQKSKITS